MNKLVDFLCNNPPPCDDVSCSTCGGTRRFRFMLKITFLKSDEIVSSLKEIAGHDVQNLIGKEKSVQRILNDLQQDEQNEVYHFWYSKAKDDPLLAFGVLMWTEYGRIFPQELLLDLITYAEPIILRNHKYRHELKKYLPADLQTSICLQSIFAIDENIEEQ